MGELLVTFQPGFELLAERDVHHPQVKGRIQAQLMPGVWWITGPLEPAAMATQWVSEGALAVRHCHPVDLTLDAGLSLEEVVLALKPLWKNLPGQARVSVQTRVVGAPRQGFKAYDLNDACEVALRELRPDLVYDRKEPRYVVSIGLGDKHIFAGVSAVKLNLSPWPGGEARYHGGADSLSRAKKKLMEAFDIFEGGTLEDGEERWALDLGAAPGGWSQYLLECGYEVVAVDPALLDWRLDSPKLRHERCTAEMYFERNPRACFDLIVSDMRIDARDGARLLCEMTRHLEADGVIVSTLKLPEQGYLKPLDGALKMLRECFDVKVRQLFHNRHEVTVLLRPRR